MINLGETNQLTPRAGRLFRMIVWTAAASGITVDIYDDPAANNFRVWSEVIGASALVIREFHLPMQGGVRIVTAGVSGTVQVCITYA